MEAGENVSREQMKSQRWGFKMSYLAMEGRGWRVGKDGDDGRM